MSDTPADILARVTPDSAARRIRGLSDRAIAWIFVAPTILLLLAINIFPLIWTIRLSFTNFRANRPNEPVEFVGLRNYQRILTDADTWATMQATAHFLFWTIVLQVLIGFTLAWLINRKFRGNDLMTTLIVLPMMLSPAVVGNFWTFLYQPQIGLINYAVEFLTGIPASSFTMLGSVALAPWAVIIVDTWMWTPFVMLICLAGLRVDPRLHLRGGRGGPRLEMAAVLDHHDPDGPAVPDAGRPVPGHRELQDVRPGGAADRRRPRRHHASVLDRAEARGVREMADGVFQRLRDHPLRHRLRPRLDLREGAEQGQREMTAYSITEPSQRSKWVAGVLVTLYMVITLLPLAWIVSTGFKTGPDSISYPPKVFFQPSIEGYVNLFTDRTRATPEQLATHAAARELRRGNRAPPE